MLASTCARGFSTHIMFFLSSSKAHFNNHNFVSFTLARALLASLCCILGNRKEQSSQSWKISHRAKKHCNKEELTASWLSRVHARRRMEERAVTPPNPKPLGITSHLLYIWLVEPLQAYTCSRNPEPFPSLAPSIIQTIRACDMAEVSTKICGHKLIKWPIWKGHSRPWPH